MGIALGLFSAEKNNYLQDEIPSDVFSIIVDNLNPHDLASDIKFLKSIETTSKMWRKEINAHILRRINEENLSPSIVRCKTGAEAIDYIIKNKLLIANLSEFSDIADEDLNKLIENCPNLHMLYLHSTRNKEVSLEKLTALQSLDLIGFRGFSEHKLAEALGKLTALRSLNLEWCSPLSGNKLAEALEKLTALQSLDLGCCMQLSGEKLAEALGKLTTLNSLNLALCTQLSRDKLVEALGKLTALQSLDLRNCTGCSGDKLAEALGKLTALKSLNLSWLMQLQNDKLAEALCKLTALQRLDIRGRTQLLEDKLGDVLSKLAAQGVKIFT